MSSDAIPAVPLDRIVLPWWHTVGVGQYFGTVKFHRFQDCGHLRKERPHWSGPVKKWTTTNLYTRVDYEERDVPESRRCQTCERRYRQNNPAQTRPAKSP